MRKPRQLSRSVASSVEPDLTRNKIHSGRRYCKTRPISHRLFALLVAGSPLLVIVAHAAVFAAAPALTQGLSRLEWTVSVKVRTRSGVPLSGATVNLVFNDASRTLATDSTSGNGEARLRLATNKPRDLSGLNLLLYVENTGYAPALVRLSGSTETIFSVVLENVPDRVWIQRITTCLPELRRNAGAAADLVLPFVMRSAAGNFVPIGVLITGDPCAAMPPGIQCVVSRGVDTPTVAINGRVAFGKYKGRTISELSGHR